MGERSGELRPAAPVTRPASARPRAGPSGDGSAPPSTPELDAMERHLGLMATHVGAQARADPDLDGLLIVVGVPPGRGIDQGSFVRWPDGWADARTAAFETSMRAQGAWPALVVVEGRSTPADLTTTLSQRGWTWLSSETVLWTRRAAPVPHLDPSLRLEAVTARSAAEHEDLERHIFGVPESSAAGRLAGTRRGIDDGTLRAFLLRSRGEAIAVARLSLREGMAALAGIGVTPGRRGEGLGGLITAICLRAGLALGRPLVWLSVDEHNDEALAVYDRLGFRPGFRWHRWLAPAPVQKE